MTNLTYRRKNGQFIISNNKKQTSVGIDILLMEDLYLMGIAILIHEKMSNYKTN